MIQSIFVFATWALADDECCSIIGEIGVVLFGHFRVICPNYDTRD